MLAVWSVSFCISTGFDRPRWVRSRHSNVNSLGGRIPPETDGPLTIRSVQASSRGDGRLKLACELVPFEISIFDLGHDR